MKNLNFRFTDQEYAKYGKISKSDLIQLLELRESIKKSYINLENEEIILDREIFEKLIKQNNDIFEKNNIQLSYYINLYGISTYIIKLKKMQGKMLY